MSKSEFSTCNLFPMHSINGEITIEVKTVYGNETIYPVCDMSKKLATLAGTITITRQALEIIKTMGFQINVKQTEFKL